MAYEVWNHGGTQKIPWEGGVNIELLANSGIQTSDTKLARHLGKFHMISVKEIGLEKWNIAELNERARELNVWEFGLSKPELIKRISSKSAA